jgi:hypothetical protein
VVVQALICNKMPIFGQSLREALPSPPTFASDAPRKATSRLKGKPAPTPRNSPTALSVEIEAYHQRENPSDISLPGVPELEWKQWMQQLRTLKIVMVARLTMTENGPRHGFRDGEG